MDNKAVFSKNLKEFMFKSDKARKEVSEAIGVSYFTFSDWVNGKKYPRMDKSEKLAFLEIITYTLRITTR